MNLRLANRICQAILYSSPATIKQLVSGNEKEELDVKSLAFDLISYCVLN